MTQPVDVGAMLGGRYKITGQVLVSADSDYVFDGVDQVLSRKVSILVPAQSHAEDMAHHARQVAVGERSDPLQILDLGRSQGHPYVVTNRASAPELLDLILAEDAAASDDEAGQPFDVERETNARSSTGYRDDEPDDADRAFESEFFGGPTADTVESPAEGQDAEPTRGRSRWNFGRFGAAAGAGVGVAAGRHAGASGTAATGTDGTDAVDTTSFDTVDARSVDDQDYWDDTDAAVHGSAPQERAGVLGSSLSAEDADDALPDAMDDDAHGGSTVGSTVSAGDEQGVRDDVDDTDDVDDLDDRENDPRFSRALILVLVAVLVVGAAVFVFSQLGQFTGTGPGTSAARSTSSASASAPAPSASGSAAPSSAPATTAPPVITGVTREMKNNQYEAISQLDRLLPRLFDGNEATDWFSSTYSSANFGGLADNLALVFELRDPARVSRVDITQRGGLGGNFQVMVNNQPTIDGARQVAQGSFTSPEVSIALPAGAPTGKYLIVNFTELPRINEGQFPYGVRIGEIALS